MHYAGVAPDMEALLALASSRGLQVVEDAAQGLGATLPGPAPRHPRRRRVLQLPRDQEHHLRRGGRPGRCATPSWSRRAEIIREKGTNRSAFLRGEVDKYTWVAEGSSYVLSDVLAAILDAQLDKLERDPGPPAAAWPSATGRGSPTGRRARGVRLSDAARRAHRQRPPLLPALSRAPTERDRCMAA